MFSDVMSYQIGAGGLTVDKKTQPIVVSYVSGNYFAGLGNKTGDGTLYRTCGG